MYQEVRSEKKLNVSQFFEKKSLIIYLISILMGMAKLSSGATPFGLALLGAIGECGFPLILPLVMIGASTWIAFGGICLLKFLMGAILFITMKSFLKENSKTSLAAKMLFATAISEIVVLAFSHTLIYDGIMAAFMSVTTAIFFLIFSEGLPIFMEWGRQKVTTYETLMAVGILMTVAASCVSGVTIWGLSITNIICILVVMFMGWRKGMTCGVVSGLSVSMALGIMGLAGASTVATYVICGLLSGILSRFGKVGAMIGFILGNAVWAFYCNASTEVIIPIGEIIIASVFLFFLPKRVAMAVDHLLDMDNVLEGRDPIGYLAESTIAKLKSVSEVADDMAKNVEDGATIETDEIGNYRKAVKENTCQKCPRYRNCWEKNYHSLYEVIFNAFESLKENGEITEDIWLGNCENTTLFKAGLQNAYSLYQVNKEWGNKVKEDKHLVAKQLRGVSQAIDSVGNGLREEEEKHYLGAGYHLECATAEAKKRGNKISGDTIKYVQLKNGKLLVGISDGMGSGETASQSSQKVLALIEKYFNTGLEKNVVLDLMNSYMMLGENKENYASLDTLLWNEETGKAQMMKLGACPTFIVENNQVRMISSKSLPVGAMLNNQAEILEENWNRGTIVVMISDGVLEAITKKENGMIELLASISKNNIQRIADIVLQEAIDANMGMAKDDMSVVVLKVC